VASVSHPDSDRLLMGSALRRSGVCRVICAVLLAVLVFDLLAAACRIGQHARRYRLRWTRRPRVQLVRICSVRGSRLRRVGVAPYGLQLGSRYALFGLGGHVMFTGIFGALLGLAIQTRRRRLRVLSLITGLVLAIAAHMLNNALPLPATLAGAAAGEAPPGHEPHLTWAFSRSS
jgi:protease prsW family protein